MMMMIRFISQACKAPRQESGRDKNCGPQGGPQGGSQCNAPAACRRCGGSIAAFPRHTRKNDKKKKGKKFK
jgi:hypothetical protein